MRTVNVYAALLFIGRAPARLHLLSGAARQERPRERYPLPDPHRAHLGAPCQRRGGVVDNPEHFRIYLARGKDRAGNRYGDPAKVYPAGHVVVVWRVAR